MVRHWMTAPYLRMNHPEGILDMVRSQKLFCHWEYLHSHIGGSTERYFDQAELRELFKLVPHDAPCSILTKLYKQSAMSSLGKPSFLSTHPNIIGVASHYILYNDPSSNDCSTVNLTTSFAVTPFSRSYPS